MINLLTNNDNQLKQQIEFLIGREIPLTTSEVNSLAHLTTGNLWVLKVLEKLNLTVDDIIYKKDREILKREMK